MTKPNQWGYLPFGETCGFVPTMGGLHLGHESLIQKSVDAHPKTVVSIYVNPLQFGPTEDFDRYPRPMLQDRTRVSRYKTAHLWVPSTGLLYPNGLATAIKIDTGSLGQVWCGQTRPHFFDGIANVIIRLCMQMRPSHLYVGEKDYQQYKIIQHVVSEFALPIAVIACPVIRESDGLAMSSRNLYLDASDRKQAPIGYQALTAMQQAFYAGETDPSRLIAIGKKQLGTANRIVIDYLGIANPDTLAPVQASVRETDRIMLAFSIGKTRLIDTAAFDDCM